MKHVMGIFDKYIHPQRVAAKDIIGGPAAWRLLESAPAGGGLLAPRALALALA